MSHSVDEMFYERAPACGPPPGVVFGTCNGLFLEHRRHVRRRAPAAAANGGKVKVKRAARAERFMKGSRSMGSK